MTVANTSLIVNPDEVLSEIPDEECKCGHPTKQHPISYQSVDDGKQSGPDLHDRSVMMLTRCVLPQHSTLSSSEVAGEQASTIDMNYPVFDLRSLTTVFLWDRLRHYQNVEFAQLITFTAFLPPKLL
jgi:hypothetical protein